MYPTIDIVHAKYNGLGRKFNIFINVLFLNLCQEVFIILSITVLQHRNFVLMTLLNVKKMVNVDPFIFKKNSDLFSLI